MAAVARARDANTLNRARSRNIARVNVVIFQKRIIHYIRIETKQMKSTEEIERWHQSDTEFSDVPPFVRTDDSRTWVKKLLERVHKIGDRPFKFFRG